MELWNTGVDFQVSLGRAGRLSLRACRQAGLWVPTLTCEEQPGSHWCCHGEHWDSPQNIGLGFFLHCDLRERCILFPGSLKWWDSKHIWGGENASVNANLPVQCHAFLAFPCSASSGGGVAGVPAVRHDGWFRGHNAVGSGACLRGQGREGCTG